MIQPGPQAQQEIRAALLNNQVVELDSGEFLLQADELVYTAGGTNIYAALRLRDGVLLKGRGPSTVLKLAPNQGLSGEERNLIHNATPAIGNAWCGVRDLVVDGQQSLQPTGVIVTGVHFDHVHQGRVTDVIVRNCYWGIVFDQDDVSYSHSTFCQAVWPVMEQCISSGLQGDASDFCTVEMANIIGGCQTAGVHINNGCVGWRVVMPLGKDLLGPVLFIGGDIMQHSVVFSPMAMGGPLEAVVVDPGAPQKDGHNWYLGAIGPGKQFAIRQATQEFVLGSRMAVQDTSSGNTVVDTVS